MFASLFCFDPLLTAHCPLLTAHCSLLTAHCPLLTAHCSLLTAHCPPLTAYSLPLTASQCLMNISSCSMISEFGGAAAGAERIVFIACSAERIPEIRILNSSGLLALCNASSIEMRPDWTS